MILFWFRKDLRLQDNKALFKAKETGEDIKYIYIKDENILFDSNKRRKEFILKAIDDLNDKLNGELIIKEGKPLEEFKKLGKDDFKIYFNRNYEPYEIKRDEKIEEEFKTYSFKDFVLHEKDEILTNKGTPYKVFTSYYNKWKNEEKEIEYGNIKSIKVVDDFIEENILKYEENRDIPFLDYTSHLSKYINNGLISIRYVYYRALEKYEETKNKNVLTFIKQLAWREFYIQFMYHFPYVKDKSFKEKYRNFRWNNNEEHIKRWKEGKTGYPIVDAGMRQLNQTGYMHNRLRMITSSFLIKDLNVDWKIGEKYFKEKLIDYDLALNNGGWQWSASTGADSVPYFRIFNPETQSKRFDKDGEYIKKWVEELEDIEIKNIHNPNEKERKKVSYPKKIVEHNFSEIKMRYS